MGLPRLSVVVPNYNHGKWLPACIEALLAQSISPAEILLIDDGSTDGSLEVMRRYAARHPQIRVHQNERNQGVVFTMNRGIEFAQGDYIFYASADDVVLPGLFEQSLSLLSRHPQAALSCTASRWIDADTKVSWVMAGDLAASPIYLSPDDLVGRERAGRLVIVSHTAVMKLAAVKEVGGFLPQLRWHCDWFATYASAFRHGLCYIPEILSEVNLHRASYYGSGRRRQEHDRVMEDLLVQLNREEYRDVAERVRESGALALHAVPMLRAILRRREYRHFLTPLLVRKILWRQVQLLGRRYLPAPLARFAVRWILRQKASPAVAGKRA